MISGHSHSFDTGIAKTLGINAAIVFNHIVYWIGINAAKDSNMRDGKFWMYETQQDMADYLEYMTLEEVKKSVVKLLDAGLLIKANYNSNPFDRTSWYTTADPNIYRIKKTLTKAPDGAMQNATRSDAKRHTAPCIYKEQKEQQKEQQQGEAPPPPVVSAAASFSAVKKETATTQQQSNREPQVYACCDDVDIPYADKLEISQRYDEATVKNAIGWATHPKTKLSKGLAPAIKWACQNKPQAPRNPMDDFDRNKAYAMKYDMMKNEYANVYASTEGVEISYNAEREAICIGYKEKAFIEQFQNALRKSRFTIL